MSAEGAILLPSRPSSLGELLLAFSSVASAGLGFPPEHGVRACLIALRIGEELVLPPDSMTSLYYVALAKDAGCACGASQMAVFLQADEREALADLVESEAETELQMLRWLFRHAGRGGGPAARTRRILDALLHARRFEQEASLEECEVAQQVARRLGLERDTAEALGACAERWDGQGTPRRLRGEEIPLAARIVNLASAVEIAHRVSGPTAAIDLVRRRAGRAFDPRVADALLICADREAFWGELEADQLHERVLALEPEPAQESPPGERPDGLLDRFTETLADLADLKRAGAGGHARRVAALAGRTGEQLGLSVRDLVTLRRAALIHDVGLASVSAHALRHGSPALVEGAPYRVHPLTTAQLLSSVRELRPACQLAALHHERLDGSGYPAARRADGIPAPARILAAGCRYDELASAAEASPGDVVERLRAEPGFDSAVLAALEQAVGASHRRRPQSWPAGLSDREVEVLRLAAAGMTVREIAGRLVISHHTVRHHFENAYAKIGVSTRAAAVLFAAEHDLLH